MTSNAFYTLLEHEGIVSIAGSEAEKFLQGQLTCNIDYLNAHTAGIGARCNNKGRMLSTFRIVTDGNAFCLALASELIQEQMADLSKYAVFSKVTLSDVSSQWFRYGLYQGQEALRTLGFAIPEEQDAIVRQPNGSFVIARAGSRFELWCPLSIQQELLAQLGALLEVKPLNDWLLLQIVHGEGQIFGVTRDQYIPQMLNLQAIGGVSFKKGCYMGQEIVARTQYLGRLKRRMFRLEVSSHDLPDIATPLFSVANGSRIGEVVLAAQAKKNVEVLAVIQADAVESNTIALGSPEGPSCILLPLPYSLDRNEEIRH